MNTVLVTGGSGLTGHAIRSLGKPGHVFWSSKDCDLTDAAATTEAVTRLRPEGIINLASVSGGVGLSTAHPATLLRDNVRINLNILEAARAVGARVVLSLSSGMYPPTAALPLKEESLHDGAAHASNYGYAHAKRLIEPMIRAWRTEFGIRVVGLSPNSIIGEHDHYYDEHANMTAALIRRCHENRDSDRKIVVWGDGSPLRELSWAGDIARDFVWALEHYDDDGILNVGTTEEISVRDVAHTIGECMGIPRKRFIFDDTRPSGVPRKSTDNSRYRSLSKASYMPIRDAIRRAVAWYEANPEVRRGAAKA